ncbi:MAG: glycosyltransferase family 39 protein [Kiritimatiellales bacterium]
MKKNVQTAKAPMPRKYDFAFLAILGVGLLLRLFWLGRASLQIDEIVTIRDALFQSDIFSIYQTELQRFHWYRVLPLFMVPIHYVGKWLGVSQGFPPEFYLRLPGALISCLLMPLMYWLTRALAGRRAGLIAMSLAALSPFHTYYAREAYAYGYLMFFSTGMLWCSLRILMEDWRKEDVMPWRWLAGYAIFASLFLQTHLTATIFLSVWTPIFGLSLIWRHGLPALWKRGRLLLLGLIMVIPYLLFSPFLIRLLTNGYKSTDVGAGTCYFTPAAALTLVSRMGWGEAWITAAFFLLVCGWGICRIARVPRKDIAHTAGMILLLQAIIYVAFQATYQIQTNSRFEVRYFCSLFPILIAFAGLGADALFSGLFAKTKGEVSLSGGMVRRTLGIVLAAILVSWLLLNDLLVIGLKSRGYNYKDMAQWIGRNVPEGGLYANMSIYEMRGVPSAYPTPGRQATFVSANSTTQDFLMNPVPVLTRSLFSLQPDAYLLEITPYDILVPEQGQPPIPRDELFMRHIWLVDNAWEWLIRLRTLPIGERQAASIYMPRVLISWNEPGDAFALAARNNRPFSHEWGPQWRYVKQSDGSPRLNMNWMRLSGVGQLLIGNTGTNPATAAIKLTVLSPGCRVTVRGPAGEALISGADISGGPGVLTVPSVALTPGTNIFNFQVTPRSANVAGELFVNQVSIEAAGN